MRQVIRYLMLWRIMFMLQMAQTVPCHGPGIGPTKPVAVLLGIAIMIRQGRQNPFRGRHRDSPPCF